MFMSDLPKEIRLQIWGLAYFAQSPRLVAIETIPHEEDHAEDTFCPRYSPSPAPLVVNICQESRAEARYQALKAEHVVTLPCEHETICCREFYFRFDTDILFLQFEGPHVKHYDDSPEVGLLAHFREATGCNSTMLQNVAITKVVYSGYVDGSLTNVLRDFPTISRMIMMINEDIWDNVKEMATFWRAAKRIVLMYEIDMIKLAHEREERFKPQPFEVDFATRHGSSLEIVPRDVWGDWEKRDRELGWLTLSEFEADH